MATRLRIAEWGRRVVARVRSRSDLVDHGFRAAARYREVYGARLAAASAYYGFFALFALAVVAYAGLGFLVERQVDVRAAVDGYLEDNLPVLDADEIAAGRGAAGALGLAGLVFTGLAWVGALRVFQRMVWRREPAPGKMLVRRAYDLAALVALSVLLALSLGLAAGVEALLSPLPAALTRPAGWLLTLGVDLVLAAGLLAAVPRLRIPARRLLPPAAAVAVGMLLLSTLGQVYFRQVQQNPAYAVVATAAGLLVYLYLVHQLVIAAAAWAATAGDGRGSAGPAEE